MNDLYVAKLDENLTKQLINEQIFNAEQMQKQSQAYPLQESIIDDTILRNNSESTESYDEEYDSEEYDEEDDGNSAL